MTFEDKDKAFRLLEEFSKLISDVEQIERKIGELTKPMGCRIYRTDIGYYVIKPPKEVPGGKVQEILIVSEIDDYVIDRNMIDTLLDKLSGIKRKMDKIVIELENIGMPGIKPLKMIAEEYCWI